MKLCWKYYPCSRANCRIPGTLWEDHGRSNRPGKELIHPGILLAQTPQSGYWLDQGNSKYDTLSTTLPHASAKVSFSSHCPCGHPPTPLSSSGGGVVIRAWATALLSHWHHVHIKVVSHNSLRSHQDHIPGFVSIVSSSLSLLHLAGWQGQGRGGESIAMVVLLSPWSCLASHQGHVSVASLPSITWVGLGWGWGWGWGWGRVIMQGNPGWGCRGRGQERRWGCVITPYTLIVIIALSRPLRVRVRAYCHCCEIGDPGQGMSLPCYCTRWMRARIRREHVLAMSVIALPHWDSVVVVLVIISTRLHPSQVQHSHMWQTSHQYSQKFHPVLMN